MITPERRAEIEREIATMRGAAISLASASRQNEVPALYSVSGIVSAYADLAQHALERDVDYQYDLPSLSKPPAHKGIYIGEKLRQLFHMWMLDADFREYLLGMFLTGERAPFKLAEEQT